MGNATCDAQLDEKAQATAAAMSEGTAKSEPAHPPPPPVSHPPAPHPPAMGIPAVGFPATSQTPRYCKPESSRVEMARRDGALHVRIPAPGFFQRGVVGWILCLLTPLFLILAVAASFFFVGTFWLLLGIAISTISWVGVATRRETITLGPDAFSVVHTRYGFSKRREGSTHFIHSILIVDRNAPRLLPPPHSTMAPGIPVPGPTPPTAAAPAAAASGSAPTARRGPAAAAAATANARAQETPAEPPELLCVIALPDTVHRFGANLSDAEKYWVVGELSYYLQSVRLHPAQQNV